MKNTIIIITSIIIFHVVEYGYGQRNKCGLDKFQCKDGQCISSALLCDGRPDCNDQSDETFTECRRPEIICPEFAFQCSYGGCVDGDVTCNGVKDCIDNSDETLPRCTHTEYNTSVTCWTNQFRCSNGQCIPGSSLCDGTADCTDNSDETLTQCEPIVCSQFLFRCNYGACINGDLKCNGVRNCADGSDEEPRLCKDVDTQPPVTTSTEFTTSTNTQSSKPKLKYTCIAPPQPGNGTWRLHQSLCPNEKLCSIAQNSELEPGTRLIYSCNSGYKIEGSSEVFCDSTGKLSNIPQCIEIRCKALHSASVAVDCTKNGEYVSCQYPALPGTMAILKCQHAYQPSLEFTNRQVICKESGNWAPEPMRCNPECGIIPSSNVKPTIVSGVQANITEFPWHATLYKADGPDSFKKFICGATIVHVKFLITAAHCVHDGMQVENASKFYIATGNTFQDYDSPFHNLKLVKKARVKKIHTICTYNAENGNYIEDIAILEISEPFTLSSLLMPACLNTDAENRIDLSGMIGKVAGFGKTIYGSASNILQSVTLPYVPFHECASASQKFGTRKYVTPDKFCAGYTNGTSVCDGDSGGGLVFENQNAWYLEGIVSLSLSTKQVETSRTCDSTTYSLFTRISYHLSWIKQILYRSEDESYPLCNLR